MKRLRRAAVPLCLGAALLAGCKGPAPDAPRERVYIPRGISLVAATESLAVHGIVVSPRMFRLYARIRGLGQRIQPGLYQFARHDRWRTIVLALKSGRTADIMFTVPEGLTVEQIADLAAEKLHLARDSTGADVRDSFLAAARDPNLRLEYGIKAPARGVREPLEGYLLPETYRVTFDATPRDVVRQMIKQANALWDTSAQKKAAALGLTRNQVLTLASIVEAEARVPAERRRIAGVYFNRYKRHMLLQADPTVIYAMDRKRHINRVLLKYLNVASPYNTYRRPGLPPGPINNPGAASIAAALDPEPNSFYYFVARPDGHHMFSRTSREHADSVAVARVLRAEYEARQDSIEKAARDSVRAAQAARTPVAVPAAPAVPRP